MSSKEEDKKMKPTDKRPLVPERRFPEFRDAGEWTSIELGNISELVTERVGTSHCTPYTITSGIGLVSQEEKLGRTIAGNSLKNYIVLQRNDFAYNKSATKAYPQGFIALYDGDDRAAVPNSIFTCFRVNGTVAIPDFLDKLFYINLHGKWLRNRIAIGARAHGSLQVNDEDLMAVPIPLPKGVQSLAEQQKIADCLSSLDELISLEAQRLDALKAHKKGMMQQLFPGEGETVPRLRFPEFRDAGEWEEKEIGAVFTFRQGYQVPVEQQYPVSNSNRERFIRIIDITQQNEPPRYIDTPQNANILCKSDLFMVRYGTPGVVAYGYEGVLANNLFQLVFNNGQTHNPSFWYQQLKLKENEISGLSGSSSMPAISFKALNYVFVKFPSLPEQSRIADCLSSLDGLITAQTDRLAALKTHKKGLMQQLFPAMDREEIARGDAEGAEDR